MRKVIGTALIVIGLLLPVPYVYFKYVDSEMAQNTFFSWSVSIGMVIALVGLQLRRKRK